MPLTSKLIALGLFLLHALICFWYYKRQASGSRIGGPISVPKVIWLFLTTYHYFMLAPCLYLGLYPAPTLALGLSAFCLLIGFRMVLQLLLMFFFKVWTPIWGISLNGLYVVTLLLILLLGPVFQLESIPNLMVFFTLLVLVCMMVLDSYYAWSFRALVGQQTKGSEAIWYASDTEPKFEKLNHQTRIFNLFFLLFTGVEFVLIVLL